MDLKDKVRLILTILISFILVGSFFHLSNEFMGFIVQWVTSLLVGIFMSAIAGELVKNFTGNLLKKISLNFSIYGFNLSITLFIIITFLVKFILF